MLESGKVNTENLKYKLGDLYSQIRNIESDISDLKEIIGIMYREIDQK